MNRFRDDAAHQAVHSFNETTPVSGSNVNAYKDLLWRDTTVPKGDLKNFKLSHLSRGPGYVYARSSWDEDATYFFFKCGGRFTSRNTQTVACSSAASLLRHFGIINSLKE